MNKNFEPFSVEENQVAWIEEDSLVIASEGQGFSTPLAQGIIQFLELDVLAFEEDIYAFEEGEIDDNTLTQLSCYTKVVTPPRVWYNKAKE